MKRGKNWTLQSASFQNPSCCSLVNPRSCFESNSLRSRVLGGRSFQRLLSINAIARLIKLQKKRQMTENEEIIVKMINLLNCVSLCHQGTTRRGDSARRRRPGWRSQQATSPVPRPASSFSLNSSSCILWSYNHWPKVSQDPRSVPYTLSKSLQVGSLNKLSPSRFYFPSFSNCHSCECVYVF